mgnify:CR=1 FL=1
MLRLDELVLLDVLVLLDELELLGELELLEELELLGELELGGLGGAVLGVEGVWGWVGLLELGQPASNRHRAIPPDILAYGAIDLLSNSIGPYDLLRRYRFPLVETGSERGLAQHPHEAIGDPIVLFIVVHALKV